MRGGAGDSGVLKYSLQAAPQFEERRARCAELAESVGRDRDVTPRTAGAGIIGVGEPRSEQPLLLEAVEGDVHGPGRRRPSGASFDLVEDRGRIRRVAE